MSYLYANTNESYFDHISDGVLHMRGGPVNAQMNVQTAWIMFDSVAKTCSIPVVLALEVPVGAVFSRDTEIHLEQSELPITCKVSLSELLEDIYTTYHSWPDDDCILHFYMDGMQVYELTLRLDSNN